MFSELVTYCNSINSISACLLVHVIQKSVSRVSAACGARTLDTGFWMTYLLDAEIDYIYAMFSVIIPHIKQANSLATAVFATFEFTPLNIIF